MATVKWQLVWEASLKSRRFPTNQGARWEHWICIILLGKKQQHQRKKVFPPPPKE
jgi:hypothetical protein